MALSSVLQQQKKQNALRDMQNKKLLEVNEKLQGALMTTYRVRPFSASSAQNKNMNDDNRWTSSPAERPSSGYPDRPPEGVGSSNSRSSAFGRESLENRCVFWYQYCQCLCLFLETQHSDARAWRVGAFGPLFYTAQASMSFVKMCWDVTIFEASIIPLVLWRQSHMSLAWGTAWDIIQLMSWPNSDLLRPQGCLLPAPSSDWAHCASGWRRPPVPTKG